jgi:hypothetical protein
VITGYQVLAFTSTEGFGGALMTATSSAGIPLGSRPGSVSITMGMADS